MTTTNWIGYIYILTYSCIIKCERHVQKHWLKHIENVSGSFAKKALVQTIVCLVLRKYRWKKTDMQTCTHTMRKKERGEKLSQRLLWQREREGKLDTQT